MKTNDEKDTMKQNDEMISENQEVNDNVAESQEATENPVATETLKLQNEIAEQKDKYLRLYSEFDNFRKRTSKEKLELIQSANEKLINALLPVVDDFERAEKSLKEKADKDLDGIFLIYNKFKKTLEQYGVKVLEVGPGSEFNADLHEAITQIPAPDEKLKGKIVDVVEKGYLLNEKVIRFAKVVVGS